MASSGYLPGSEFAFHDLYHFRLWSVLVCCQSSKAFHSHQWRHCRPVSCWAPAAQYGGNCWRRLASAWRSVCRALMRKVWATEATRRSWFISWPKRKQMYLQEEFKELFFKYPPGNWHIPPWSEKEIHLEKCQTVRDMLVLWRLMYPLMICQAWTAFNEFELNKKHHVILNKKTHVSWVMESCQSRCLSWMSWGWGSCHPRHCYVAKMVWKAYYWLQTRWESTISLPWLLGLIY